MKARPREFASRIGKAAWYSGELYQRRAAAACEHHAAHSLDYRLNPCGSAVVG
jgi:hypothetical protein